MPILFYHPEFRQLRMKQIGRGIKCQLEMTFLSIVLVVVSGFAFGQNTSVTVQCEKVLDTLTNREIYSTVDTQAEVIGGLSTLYDEIAPLKIPIDPDVDQIRIFISFIVEANGGITGFKTINKIASLTLDKELLQLIKKHKWKPGTCKGVKVPTRLTLKVVS